MINPKIIESLLLNNFPHQPTISQEKLIEKLSLFLFNPEPNNLFILKGYAGTGKTTAISAVVNALPAINLSAVLLAPTGRAAKVLSNYSGKQAFTIHKKIYRKTVGFGGEVRFSLTDNKHTETIFIVDEASMIADTGGLSEGYFGNGSLLEDLLSFVFQGHNCRLILIGDGAQLPPVGQVISPALNADYLNKNFSLAISTHELSEVMRQKEDSGILENATKIRSLLYNEGGFTPKFSTKNFKDIIKINGTELEDALNDCYSKYGAEDTMVICRSNKRSNLFNQQIRNRILWKEEELSAGDYIMVVKNNYFWLPEKSPAGFIANGDIIEVLKVKNIGEMYGFRFADATIRLIDYPNEPSIETKLLLDTISSENPALTQTENKKLYEEVLNDYIHITDRTKRLKEIKENPFFNALQIKFAYAVTCHKAQGGQWPAVFVDQGYLTKEMLNTEYIRWLYTAISRASEKLYLVNFNEEFFS